jgi:hypothetical protein
MIFPFSINLLFLTELYLGKVIIHDCSCRILDLVSISVEGTTSNLLIEYEINHMGVIGNEIWSRSKR